MGDLLDSRGPRGPFRRRRLAAWLAGATVAERTRREYRSALRRLDGWLRREGERGLGALNDELLAIYLCELRAAGMAAASARLALAAVRWWAREGTRPSPVGFQCDQARARYERDAAGVGRGQVAPIRWSDADRMAAVAAAEAERAGAGFGARWRGLRDAAAISVGSDGMLRIGELASLAVGDLNLRAGTLTVRRSKTDQGAMGADVYLGPPTRDRLAAWLSIRSGPGPLFCTRAPGLRKMLQRRARACGVPGRISGHSLRVGAAVSAGEAGADTVQLMIAGRWRSASMPAHYARGALCARGATATLRYGGPV